MKRLLSILATLGLATGALWAQPVITTTPFTRNMLRSNDAAGVRAHIGVTTTNAGIAYAGANLGTTNATQQSLYSNTVAGVHYFRQVAVGSNMSVVPGAAAITLNANLHGTNLGTLGAANVPGEATNSLGQPQFMVYKDTSGKWHRFFTLEMGSNMVGYSTPTSIVVNASAAGGGGGVATNLIYSNTVFLAVNGDDGTAVKGDMAKPYASASNAVAALTNGDTLLIYPGIYPVPMPADHTAGTLALTKKTNISVIALGPVELHGTNSPNGSMWKLTSCSNVTFSGLQMIGDPSHPGSPGEALAFAVDLGGTNTVLTFEGCQFKSWGRFGIAHFDPVTSMDRFVRIKGCVFTDIGGTNFTAPETVQDGAGVVVCGNNWEITDSWFIRTMRGVEIFTGPYDLPISDISIVDNHFIDLEGTPIVMLNQSTDASFVTRIGIRNNVISGDPARSWPSDAFGIAVSDAQDVDISNNRISGINAIGDGAIAIVTSKAGAKNYSLIGNVITKIVGGPAIKVYLSAGDSVPLPEGINISENIIDTIDRSGIEVTANNALIQNNIIRNISTNTLDNDLHAAIWLRTLSMARPAASNIVVDGNFFGDTSPGTGTTLRGIKVDTNVHQVRIGDNYAGYGITFPLTNSPAATNIHAGLVQVGPSTNSILAPSAGQVMTWNGSNWVATTVSGGSGDQVLINGAAIVDPNFKDYSDLIDADSPLGVVAFSTDSATNVVAYALANSATNAGVVAEGGSNYDRVWKTDGSGVPAWRVDETAVGGGDSITVNGSAVVDPNFTNDTTQIPAASVGVAWGTSANKMVGTIGYDATYLRAAGTNAADTNKLTIVGSTGTGNFVLAGSPSITTPTIASFAEANHSHQDDAGGATLDAAAIAAGTIGTARLGTGTANGSTYLRGDQTWATPAGTGTVVGPSSTVKGQIPYFLGTDGTVITNSLLVTLSTNGTLTASNIVTTNLDVYGVAGPSSITLVDTNGTNIVIAAPRFVSGTNQMFIVPSNAPASGKVLTVSTDNTNTYWATPSAGAGSNLIVTLNGTNVGQEPRLNFVEGANITLTGSTGTWSNTITIASSGGGTNADFLFVTNALSASNVVVRGDGGAGMVRLYQAGGASNFVLSVQADYPTNVTLLAMTNIAQGIVWSEALGQTNRLQILPNGSDGQVVKMSGTTLGWGTDATAAGGGDGIGIVRTNGGAISTSSNLVITDFRAGPGLVVTGAVSGTSNQITYEVNGQFTGMTNLGNFTNSGSMFVGSTGGGADLRVDDTVFAGSASITGTGTFETLNVNASGIVTNIEIRGSGAATNFFPTNATFYHYLYVPAGSMLTMSNATANTFSNAALAKRDTFDFDDGAPEWVAFNATLGDGWDLGTIKAKFHWQPNATNGGASNVIWGIRARQTINTNLGAVQGTIAWVTNAGSGITNQFIVSSASPAVTVSSDAGGLVKGYPIDFAVVRDAGNASDNRAGDARLMAVEIQYGVKFNQSTGW